MRKVCPTPNKQSFNTRDSAMMEALWAEKRPGSKATRLWVYPCGSHFHLTGQKHK